MEGFCEYADPSLCEGPSAPKRQLVLITPTKSYDLEQGVNLGVARGVAWWYPHTPLPCKVVNVTTSPVTLQRGMKVATVYALNASDIERIKLLHEPLPTPAPDDGIDVVSDADAEAPVEPVSDKQQFQVALSNTNMGQLNSRVKAELLELLQAFRDKGLFALDPKKVPVCNGPPMELPLLDEKARPFQAKQRRYSPEETAMIQAEVQKMVDAGIIQRST